MTQKPAPKPPSFDEMMDYRDKRFEEFHRKAEEVKKEVFGDLDEYYLSYQRDKSPEEYSSNR